MIVPRSAIPKAVPISRIAPLIAEATPLFSLSTLFNTAVVIGAKIIDIPKPITMKAGTMAM